MIYLKLSKPAEKLKLASNWNTTNNFVWIPHSPLMVTEKKYTAAFINRAI